MDLRSDTLVRPPSTRRALLSRTGAALMGAVTVACEGVPGGRSSGAVSKEPVTVRFTTPGAARRADDWKPVVDLAAQAHPRLKLEFAPIEREAGALGERVTYREHLQIQLAAGTPPDVVALGPSDMLALQASNALADLSGYAKASKPAELQLDDFWPDQLAASRVGGALYALPWQGDPLLLYFNDAIFRAKGIKTPRELHEAGIWTWQTFVDAAQRITGPAPAGLQAELDAQRRRAAERTAGRGPGGGAAAGSAGQQARPSQSGSAAGQPGQQVYGADRGTWETWVWSNGGEILDASLKRCLLDSAAAVEALAFMGALTTKYQVVPSARELRGTNEVTLFDNGQLGMFMDTRAAVPRLARLRDGTWDAVPVPSGKKASLTRLTLTVFAVPSAAAAPEPAYKAVRFLTSAAAQRQWAQRGAAIPSRKSAAASAEVLQFAGPTQATPKANASFLEVLQRGGARLPPALAQWPELNQAVNRELRPLFQGEREAVEAARAAKAQLELLLAGGA